jgi:hypothetical protein
MGVPSDGDLREDRDQGRHTKLYVEIGIGTPIVFVHEYC